MVRTVAGLAVISTRGIDPMLLRSDYTRSTFRKLGRQLSKVARKPTPKNVHKFRTSCRRAEVLLADFNEKPTGNDRRLLKLLGRLRKKAGKLRDLDVQSAALRSLKIPQEPARKSQLMRTLAEEREKRERKLAKSTDRKAISEAHKRLKRAASSLEIRKNAEPLSMARQKLNEIEISPSGTNAKTLHQFRIAGKSARYIAEFAVKNAESAGLIASLKRMQDVIGEWHDWIQLTERAEKLFGGIEESALVAALTNVTRAKFRLAVNILNETRSQLAGKKQVSGSSSSNEAVKRLTGVAAVA
jgi:CHAD domain-containing protein